MEKIEYLEIGVCVCVCVCVIYKYNDVSKCAGMLAVLHELCMRKKDFIFKKKLASYYLTSQRICFMTLKQKSRK